MEKVIIPLITPFKEDYSIDMDCFAKHISWLYVEGIRGFFTPSSTGEIDKISPEEVFDIAGLFETTLNGNYELYIGLKSENPLVITRLANKLLDQFKIDGFIIPAPSYFRYRDAELTKFYSIVANDISSKIIIYNIPGLTGNLIRENVYQSLINKHDNIVGTKITYNDVSFLVRILNVVRDVGKDFKVYVGSDYLIPINLTLGGYGVIPGFGNVYPKIYLELISSYEKRDFTRFLSLYNQLMVKIKELDENYIFPASIKKALNQKGGCVKRIARPPMES